MLLVVGLIGYGVARLVLAKMIKPSTTLRVGTGAQARRLRDYLDLAYDAAAWIIVFACFVDIARAWGVTFESGGMGSIIVKVGLILVAGAILYDGSHRDRSQACRRRRHGCGLCGRERG